MLANWLRNRSAYWSPEITWQKRRERNKNKSKQNEEIKKICFGVKTIHQDRELSF